MNPARPQRRRHRRDSGGWSAYLFALPYLALFTLFLIAPLVYGLGISLTEWELLSIAPPRFAGLDNFVEAAQSEYARKALWVTIQFVVLSVPLTVLTALVVAAGVRAVPASRQSFYRAAYFLPSVLTISVVGILWRWFYNSEFGLFNAYLAGFGMKVPWLTDTAWAMRSIVLMTLWWTLGGPMVILLAGLHGIPAEYHEAASLDGARGWQRFLYITMPLLRPVLLFVVVMNIIGGFQVFGQTFMVTRGGPELATRSMVQYIYETAFNNYRMGYAAALSWLLFLVIAAFSFVQFRVIREK